MRYTRIVEMNRDNNKEDEHLDIRDEEKINKSEKYEDVFILN